MASKLDAALAWAARGFKVFPVQADGKLPAIEGWLVAATTDPEVIRAWWTRRDPVVGAVVEQDHNVGVLTTGLVTFDVDTKGGKPGLRTFLDLGLEFDTLTVRTPTGGWHVYHQGIGREVGQSPLGPGVDVRSHHGYLLAPGSTIDGVPYVVEIDLPVAEVPHAVRPLLRAPRARRGGDGVSVELDQPEALEIAAYWLRREAPAAVQGQNGDDATYRVCCRLRDLGVSEVSALDLLLDEWNGRCEPPWDAGELRRKVENAWQYATGEAGSASPEALFGDVVDVPPPPVVRPPLGDAPLLPTRRMLREEDIPERDWVVPGLLLRQCMTLISAPGGAGKSLISLIVAAHLAVGRPFWHFEVRRPGRSVVYNAEDDLMEVSRRLNVICAVFGLDRDVVADNVELLGPGEFDLQITKGSNPPQVRQDHVDMVAHACARPDVVFLAIDPLVEVHTGKESDNVEMRYVMSILRAIARHADVPVLVVQHTPKLSGQASRAGEMDAARGATAIGNACRFGLTLFPATEAEALEIGASREDRKTYVRVDGAKVSYGQGRSGPLWLRWESRQIASGDSVGVLVEHDARGSRDAEATRVAGIFRHELTRRGEASVLIGEAAAVLSSNDPVAGPLPHDEAVRKLKRLLGVPVAVDGAKVVLRSNYAGTRGLSVVVE